MPPPEETTSVSADPQTVGARIDALLDASSAGGAVARERAEELVRLVTDLYGAGLERLLDIAYEAGRLDDELLARLTDDELVSGLLLVHGLHPYSVEQRVEQALDSVRPYLGSHGGDVELLGVDPGGQVRLRLLGSCDGCPSSSVTLRLAVEGAIEAAAPEVCSIEVDTGPSGANQSPEALIPVESLRSRLHVEPGQEPSGSWHRAQALETLGTGAVTTLTLDATALVACRVGDQLFAFQDRCPRCGSGLAGAGLGRRLGGGATDVLLTCPGCSAHFDVHRAGTCADLPELHLDPLPLITDEQGVSVAVPSAVVA